jgi:hypothetical protein
VLGRNCALQRMITNSRSLRRRGPGPRRRRHALAFRHRRQRQDPHHGGFAGGHPAGHHAVPARLSGRPARCRSAAAGSEGHAIPGHQEPIRRQRHLPTGPLTSPASTPLARVGSLTFASTDTPGWPRRGFGSVLVAGGVISAGGKLVPLRTYTDAYLYPAPDGDDLAALNRDPAARGRECCFPVLDTEPGTPVAVVDHDPAHLPDRPGSCAAWRGCRSRPARPRSPSHPA